MEKHWPLLAKDFFCPVFKVGRKNVLATAIDYTRSVWCSRLSNIEKLTEIGLSGAYNTIQYFISDSPRVHRKLMDITSTKASKLMSQKKPAGLSIDETGVRKKGRHSVGVGRQYLGGIGKIDNGQVAGCATLAAVILPPL